MQIWGCYAHTTGAQAHFACMFSGPRGGKKHEMDIHIHVPEMKMEEVWSLPFFLN